MKNIFIVERYTGGGWDCDTVGYFSTQHEAQTALEHNLKTQGIEYDVSTSPGASLTYSCNTCCYLVYKISKQRFNQLL